MARIKIIQIQCSTLESIGNITNDARAIVSKVCLGVDDMKLLGNKALVLRAEIYPDRLLTLYENLASIGVKLNQKDLPDIELLSKETEYPLSIQIVSFSDDTDRSASIPKVPG
ncbi:MAG: hypothetical protein KBT66_16365 [Amphritea sp.]|uniref:hypothetical protein n=1 Tax=Amphritea sp. TaxID=1872502 RepID=UPI001B440458|nr:hypothetical protein [Amphritea sp.]MBQ0785799.1 hypothetical protein [Amphritea sp.]